MNIKKIIFTSLIATCMLPGLVHADGATIISEIFKRATRASLSSALPNALASTGYWHPDYKAYTGTIACDNNTSMGYSSHVSYVEDAKGKKYHSISDSFTIYKPCKIGTYILSPYTARPLKGNFSAAASIGVHAGGISRITRPVEGGKHFSFVTISGLVANNKLLGPSDGYLSVLCDPKKGDTYGALMLSATPGKESLFVKLLNGKPFSEIVKETSTPETPGFKSSGTLTHGCAAIRGSKKKIKKSTR